LTKAKDAKNQEALLYLGKVAQLKQDNPTAISLYEEYIAGAKDTKGLGIVYNMLGMCKMDTGNYQEALNSFSAGIALNEGDSIQELLFNEVVAYEYLNDFTTAAQKMQAYLTAYPNDSTAKRENDFLKTR
jgi:tetratricopeptide (TPR) repeat protein